MQTIKTKQWILPVEILAGVLALTVVVTLILGNRETGTPTATQITHGQTTVQLQTTAEPTLPPPPPNPYKPTDFQYDGRYLTCLVDESVLGIDVSSHQQEIDWQAVAEAGIRYVMIRVGYRGYESGEITPDAYALKNYQGAKAAGLEVGAYFFSQALNPKEAREEAAFLLDTVGKWELTLPLVYDWEYISPTARTGNMDKRSVTDNTIAFCEVLEDAGYPVMVYFNRHHGEEFLHLEELTAYPFWLAMYSDRMTYPYKIAMWQYTQEGRVPGIVGNVDINLWFPGNL